MSKFDYYTEEDWKEEFKDCPENIQGGEMSKLRDQVSILVAAVDLDIIHNFDATLYADEIIALCEAHFKEKHRREAIDAVKNTECITHPSFGNYISICKKAAIKAIEERLK